MIHVLSLLALTLLASAAGAALPAAIDSACRTAGLLDRNGRPHPRLRLRRGQRQFQRPGR